MSEQEAPAKTEEMDADAGTETQNGESEPAKETSTPDKAAETACFNCGGTGHWARECTSVRGSLKLEATPICHTCKGRGHLARMCPTSRRNGTLQGCYTCGQLGHRAFECPARLFQTSMGGGGGRGRGRGGPTAVLPMNQFGMTTFNPYGISVMPGMSPAGVGIPTYMPMQGTTMGAPGMTTGGFNVASLNRGYMAQANQWPMQGMTMGAPGMATGGYNVASLNRGYMPPTTMSSPGRGRGQASPLGPPPTTNTCWTCHQPGHISRDCPLGRH